MLRKLSNESNTILNNYDSFYQTLISPKDGNQGHLMKADQSAMLLNVPTIDYDSIQKEEDSVA